MNHEDHQEHEAMREKAYAITNERATVFLFAVFVVFVVKRVV